MRKAANQAGQTSMAMAIVLMVIALMVISVGWHARKVFQSDQDTRLYQQGALSAAQAGFAEAEAWFRRQNTVPVHWAGSCITYCSGTWTPACYPDSAFKPTYNPSTFTAGDSSESINPTYSGGFTYTAAIVDTFPLHLTNSAASFNNVLWARSVVKRQALCNWSPCSGTYTAANDPTAVHDLSLTKGGPSAAPGAGYVWAIYSSGYVYQAASPLTGTAGFVNSDPLQAPKAVLNGQPLLRGSASYYGEIVSINFTAPPAAVWITNCGSITMLTKAHIDKGTGTTAIVANTGSCPAASTGVTGTTSSSSSNPVPSVAAAFGGISQTTLKNTAEHFNDIGSNPIYLLPQPGSLGFDQQASQGTSYYLEGSASFPDRTLNTSLPQLIGTGLLFVNGNLTVAAGNNASWNGVIYVNGNCVLQGGVYSGEIIVTGTLSVGISGASNDTSLVYSGTAVSTALKFFGNYHLNKASVQYSVQ